MTPDPQQRALLELLLTRGQSYASVSEALGAPPARVRALAVEAVGRVAPALAQVEARWRAPLVDYLLAQQEDPQRARTLDYLRGSAPARACVAALAASLDGHGRDAAPAPTAPTAATAPTGEGDWPEEESMSATDIRQRATTGAVLLTIRGVAIRVLALAGNLVIARLLLPRDIGLVAVGVSVMMFGDFLSNSGVGAALIRGPRAPDREDLQAVLGFQLALTILLAGLVAAIGLPLGKAGQLAAIMVVALPIQVLRQPSVVMLQRALVYRTLVIVEITDAVTYMVWAIPAVVLGFGVWGLATAVVFRALFGTALLLRLSPVGLLAPRIDVARVRPILSFGARFQGIGLLNVLRDQGLNLGTAAIAGAATLGLWTLVYRILQTLLLVFEGLWRVSFPAMARLMATGENPRPIIEKGVASIAVGSGLFLAPLVASGPALVPSVVGPAWRDAAQILPGACLGLMVVGPISVAVSGYLFAVGDAATVLRGALLHTIAQFAVAFPLLPVIGPWALGIGGLASCLVEAAVLGRAATERSGARVIAELAVPLIAATLAGAAGWLLASAGHQTFPRAVAAGALGLAGYVLVLAVVRRRLLTETTALIVRSVRRSAPGMAAT